AVAVAEAGPRVDPVRAVRDDVGVVGVASGLGGVLDADQGLLGAVEDRVAPVDRRQAGIARGVDRLVLVADDDPVRDAPRGRLVADLPVDRVRAEEGDVDARVAGLRNGVIYLL